MTADQNQTAEHWETVYQTKAPSAVSWFQSAVTPSLRMLERAAASRETRVIDVGGGASALVDALLERRFHSLAVLDIAGAALSTVRARLGTRSDAVEWIVADVTSWDPPHRFDLWHDRAVFHFLTSPEQRAAYKATVCKALEPGGWLIMATFAPQGPERCSGLPVRRWSAEELALELGPEFALVESALEEHHTPSGSAQSFVWTLFRRGSLDTTEG